MSIFQSEIDMFVSVWFRSPDTRLIKKRNFPSKQSIDKFRADL